LIIRNIESMRGTDREVIAENWTSTRLVLADDKMGFSFHETVVRPNTETKIWYKNHLESVYCIEGTGEIENENGEKHSITPGTIYVLDKHDKHILRAFTKLRMMCVFNPPLIGKETHDEEGVYPLLQQKEVS